MDINVKIIQAVKENGLLYKRRVPMEERKQSWQKIAEKLGIQQQFLTTRWHFLVIGYKRMLQGMAHFKYKNHLEFLRPFIVVPTSAPANKCPEFVITEKDINLESETEEFIFVEVRNRKGSAQEQPTMETDNTNAEAQKELQSGKDIREKPETPLLTHLEDQGGRDIEVSGDVKNIKNEDSQETSLPPHIDHEVEVVAKTEAISPTKLSPNRELNPVCCDRSSSTERSEDDIFGELVTAMIKRLPTEKKRTVKKDIMNLLFT